MQATELEFLGPHPAAIARLRPAESEPDDVPSDTKNVPTHYRLTGYQVPATAVNQFGLRVRVTLGSTSRCQCGR